MIRKTGLCLVAVVLAGPALAEDCLVFDTTATVQGKVAAVEDYWVLRVAPPMCVDVPPGDDLGTPAHNVEEVQLVLKDPATAKAYAGQSVAATGFLSPPHGAFNKRPVILEAETIKRR